MEDNKYKRIVFVKCFTFNHAPYIVDAMNGFTMQQTTFPYVCCIVDDASTDGEPEVIRKYLHDNFDLEDKSVIRNEETGDYMLCFAQHKTNKKCYFAVLWLKYNHYKKKAKKSYFAEWIDRAKYIAICEGDDYWIDPLKLQKQFDIMEAHPEYTLCGTNGLIKWDEGKKKTQLFNDIIDSRELKPKDIIGKWIFPTAGILYRREVINDYSSWKKRIYSGDLLLVLLAMNKGMIYALSDVCCVYRKSIFNTSSVSAAARKKSRDFVTNQHVILYSEFDSYTNGRFSAWIQPHLRKLRKRAKVYKAMNNSYVIAFLKNPITFCHIVFNSFKR